MTPECTEIGPAWAPYVMLGILSLLALAVAGIMVAIAVSIFRDRN